MVETPVKEALLASRGVSSPAIRPTPTPPITPTPWSLLYITTVVSRPGSSGSLPGD